MTSTCGTIAPVVNPNDSLVCFLTLTFLKATVGDWGWGSGANDPNILRAKAWGHSSLKAFGAMWRWEETEITAGEGSSDDGDTGQPWPRELATRRVTELLKPHPSPVTAHIHLEVLNFRHGFFCMPKLWSRIKWWQRNKPNVENFLAAQHDVLPPIDEWCLPDTNEAQFSS